MRILNFIGHRFEERVQRYMLQCGAVCCSVLQCVAAMRNLNFLGHKFENRAQRSQAHFNAKMPHNFRVRIKGKLIQNHLNGATQIQLLQCVALCCSVLHYVAVCCIMLQYVAVCCSLSLSVMQCAVLLLLPIKRKFVIFTSLGLLRSDCMLQGVAVCCSVLQCVAVCCVSLFTSKANSSSFTSMGP